jgi:methylase of polypeptide subunit release factors
MIASAAATDIRGGLGDVFYCPEESSLYAQCLNALIFARQRGPRTLIEFGSGDGNPVIDALRGSAFKGFIHGYELSPMACEIASARISAHGLQGRYTVHNESFFAQDRPDAECLIANPPYLPAPDSDIRLPLLYGGEDGSALTKALLSQSYDSALLMISSYSNPAGTIRHAAAEGYAVSDFIIAPLTFGFYSSEPKVKRTIEYLRRSGLAFYDRDMYLLAGVLFRKRCEPTADVSAGLIKLLTTL